MSGKAAVGELPFRWRTDFQFPWSGGWLGNQEGRLEERDLVMVIPGRDRRRAVIMADHYDTAYMEDRYEKPRGGNGARLAAAGADDNHSATAALMLGRRSSWISAGRAFSGATYGWSISPARNSLPTAWAPGTWPRRSSSGRSSSAAGAAGRWTSPASGSRASTCWTWWPTTTTAIRTFSRSRPARAATRCVWPTRPTWPTLPGTPACRSGTPAGPPRLPRGRRSPDPAVIPDKALHPLLDGEVRTPQDPRSSLFNTDGQIFSDAGIPVVLFMENYDINRVGYHDTQDTMANIDLDYGSALAAIAIETVARTAAGIK